MNDNRPDGSPGAKPTELKPVIVWMSVLTDAQAPPSNPMEESAIKCAVAALQTDDRKTKLSLLAAAGRYASGAKEIVGLPPTAPVPIAFNGVSPEC